MAREPRRETPRRRHHDLACGRRDRFHLASVQEVAVATLSCLRRHVPAAVPGPKPWKVSFSYGRALQDPALEARRGRGANLTAGKSALAHRARCYGAASLGGYSVEMEASPADADSPEHRRDWRDD